MKQKRIKNKNYFILIATTFLLFNYFIFLNKAEAIGNKFQYTNNNSEINISETSFERLVGFFEGNFYSIFLKKKITDSSGIYFAISKDGMHSVISYCDDSNIWNCSLDFARYQSVKRCEKISKQECFILANNNEILINNTIYTIKNKNPNNELTKLNKILKKFSTNKKVLHSEIRYLTIEEKNSGEDWNN